jgi:hypothetical protein
MNSSFCAIAYHLQDIILATSEATLETLALGNTPRTSAVRANLMTWVPRSDDAE